MKDRLDQIGIGQYTDLLSYYDLGTGYIWSDPVVSKDLADTRISMQYLMGTDAPIKLLYSDNADPIKMACRDLGIMRRAALRETQ